MNNLNLSPAAQNDLLEIKNYIALDLCNPSAATSTVKKLMQRIRKLKNQPLMGALLASVSSANSDERFLVSGNYLIFCHTIKSNIYIDRVLYGGRDYLRILFGSSINEENNT